MVLTNSENMQDIEEYLHRFMQRMRCRMVSPMHKFKKTDRLNLRIRYPQYREESEEEKQASSPTKKLNLQAVITRGYDQEILERLKKFFEFLKSILKPKS